MATSMLHGVASMIPNVYKFLKDCKDNRSKLPRFLKKAETVLQVARHVTEEALNGGMPEYSIMMLTNAADDLAAEALHTKEDEEAMASLEVNAGAMSAVTGSHAAQLREMIEDVEKQIHGVVKRPDFKPQDRYDVGSHVALKDSGREGVVLLADFRDPTLTYKIRFSDGSVDYKGRGEVVAAASRGESSLGPRSPAGPGAQPSVKPGAAHGGPKAQDEPGEYVVLVESGAHVTGTAAGRGGFRLDTLAFGAQVRVLEVQCLDDAIQQRVRGRICLDDGREGWISLVDTSDGRRFAERLSTGDYLWATEVFGAVLRTKSGLRATRNVLDGSTRIGVYFTASWCPPCLSFTAELSKAYGPYAAEFPVIYVPCESDARDIEEYYDTMPWFMLPQEASVCQKLACRFQARGIPHLVVLEWHKGKVVSTSARTEVQDRSFDLKKCLQLWGADRDVCLMGREEEPVVVAPVEKEPAVVAPLEEEPAVVAPGPLPATTEHWECPKCEEPNKAHRSACNNCGAGKPASKPTGGAAHHEGGERKGTSREGTAEAEPPRLLWVTGKSEQVDGMYERGAPRSDLPTWMKYEGNDPVMVMYNRAGRWAVTTPERVAVNGNFMLSQVHQGKWPQRVQQWGVMKDGNFQQLARVVVQQRQDFQRGDVVYYQGPETAFKSGDRLASGLRGEVQGLEEDGRVEVKFAGHKLATPLRGARLSRTPPAPHAEARYQPGDVVFYTGKACAFRSGDRLVAGMQGTVVDPDDNGKVCVEFEGHRCQTPLQSSELSRKDAYQLGDVVFYTGSAKSFNSGDRLRAGVRGVVVELKRDFHVSVRFDGHRCNTPTSRSELSKSPVAEEDDDLEAEDLQDALLRLLGERGLPGGPFMFRPQVW